MSAAASGPCASWRAQAVARHLAPREASGWSSAAAGLRRGAMSWCVVRAASWLEGGATPGCPAVSDECVETAATPAAHEYASFALLWAKFAGTRKFRVRPRRLYGLLAVRGACPVPGGGWGSVGRIVVADGHRRASRPSSTLYASAGDVTRVATHGRLAPTACECRLDSCPVFRPRPLRHLFFAALRLGTRGAPTRCIYHLQARPLRSSNREPCSSWSSCARSPPPRS